MNAYKKTITITEANKLKILSLIWKNIFLTLSITAIIRLNNYVLSDKSAVESAIKQIALSIKISGAQWNVESVNHILSERLSLS